MNDSTPIEDDPDRLWHYRTWWAALVAASLVANLLYVNTQQLGWYLIEVIGYTFGQLLTITLATGLVWTLFWGLNKLDMADELTARGWMTVFTVLLGLSIVGQLGTA